MFRQANSYLRQLIGTSSKLPADDLLTYHRLESVNLDLAKIISIIRAFDVSKVHGWDDVSLRVVKICDESLVKPLFNIFQFSLETGNFPSNWMRGNIVSVHKKGNKDLINYYRPVSLLPILAKCMKIVSMIHVIITLREMIYFLGVNQALVKVILTCLSCCP